MVGGELKLGELLEWRECAMGCEERAVVMSPSGLVITVRLQSEL